MNHHHSMETLKSKIPGPLCGLSALSPPPSPFPVETNVLNVDGSSQEPLVPTNLFETRTAFTLINIKGDKEILQRTLEVHAFC